MGITNLDAATAIDKLVEYVTGLGDEVVNGNTGFILAEFNPYGERAMIQTAIRHLIALGFMRIVGRKIDPRNTRSAGLHEYKMVSGAIEKIREYRRMAEVRE